MAVAKEIGTAVADLLTAVTIFELAAVDSRQRDKDYRRGKQELG